MFYNVYMTNVSHYKRILRVMVSTVYLKKILLVDMKNEKEW